VRISSCGLVQLGWFDRATRRPIVLTGKPSVVVRAGRHHGKGFSSPSAGQSLPAFSRLGVFVSPDDAAADGTLSALPSAARGLGLDARIYDGRAAAELEAAFAAIAALCPARACVTARNAISVTCRNGSLGTRECPS
jgi:hypothetical protein